jgi:hypothetical protein
MSVEIADLPPGQPCTVRVRPLDPRGVPGDPLFRLRFETPAKPRLVPEMTFTRWLGVGIAVMLGALAWLWWRERRA